MEEYGILMKRREFTYKEEHPNSIPIIAIDDVTVFYRYR
jgi:hypothetical protein